MEIQIRSVRPGDIFGITRTVLAARGFRGTELEAALERDLQRFRELQIVELVESDTLVALDGSRIIGVMRYGEFDGEVHLTRPDVDPAFGEAEVTAAFLQAFWDWMSLQSAKAVYLDYPDQEGRTRGELFLQNGFQKLIDRMDMRLSLVEDIEPLTSSLSFASYGADTHERFFAAYRASFAGSLDPMMAWDAAHPEESFEIFRERFGDFDPELWLLASDEQGEAVGFALFQPFQGGRYGGTTMLLYMAVLPEARGQGYGEEILREGLRRVRQIQGAKAIVSLTVTRGNDPAERIYKRLGFQPIEHFTVYNMKRE